MERRLPVGRSADILSAPAESRRTGRLKAGVPVFLLLLSPNLFAAVTSSALTGRVTSAGAPAPNVTVTATSPKLQATRTTVTGANGTYWLSALPPGAYEVTFSRAGLQTLTRRVTVQLARIARADAKLEPSDDEEHVTSTMTTISVVHDTPMSVHETSKTLDRRPYVVNLFVPYSLAPGVTVGGISAEVDGMLALSEDELVQSETIDEIALFRGITPIELARRSDSPIVTRTRSGGEELTVSVRDTISNEAWVSDAFHPFGTNEGTRHYLESASGGRILSNRLWFFAAGWSGSRADGVPSEPQGLELKLTAQFGARQNLTATYIDHETGIDSGNEVGSALASLVHVAQWTPRLLTEVVAGRDDRGQTVGTFPPFGPEQTAISAKAAYVLGDHVVSGGVEIENSDLGDNRSIFLHDRIWLERLVLNAGIRYQNHPDFDGYNPGGPFVPLEEEHLSAQVAAMYDLRGRGRNAISASASRYLASPFEHVDELTLGYVMALGSTGSARLDLIHRERDRLFDLFLVQLDSSYRLFDRFEAGLNYTWCDTKSAQPLFTPLVVEHLGNAWFSAEVPAGSHAIGGTIAYRYTAYPSFSFPIPDYHAVDIGLRYMLPISRVALTLAADAQNLFDSGDGVYAPRIMRGWIRVRL
ncbi:MAG TPA: TonB-dependent receptor [Thermoanaerobaculia bacterium]|nr:TonB-dependent receptor [Thermoanaerobaculia bacterium]